MTYIYDIVLNFHNNYYDYFEWFNTDSLLHIRKIPLIRVSDYDLYNFKYNDIKMSTEILDDIMKKTTFYNNDKQNKIITLLISNSKQSIALSLDNRGFIIKRSSLLPDEEDEVNEETIKLNVTKIDYLIKNKIIPNNVSRLKLKKKEYINQNINKINDLLILKYIYYDCYSKEELDIDKIKKKILKESEDSNINKIYSVIKIINKGNIKTSSTN